MNRDGNIVKNRKDTKKKKKKKFNMCINFFFRHEFLYNPNAITDCVSQDERRYKSVLYFEM